MYVFIGWRISTRYRSQTQRISSRCPVDYRAADDRGLSMHIVSDYANARTFVLLGRTPPTGVASLTATLFARRSFCIVNSAPMRHADLFAQNVFPFRSRLICGTFGLSLFSATRHVARLSPIAM